MARAFAGVAELVDALDLGSSDESRGGSSPSARTTDLSADLWGLFKPIEQYSEVLIAMQITETLSEGLKRELKVVIGFCIDNIIDHKPVLARTAIEALNPRVCIKTRDRVLQHVAVATMQLQTLIDDLALNLGRK